MRIPASICALVCVSLSSIFCHQSLHAQPQQFETRGPGGGGALFLPSFSGAVQSELSMACDMGQSFVSYDDGRHWSQRDFRQLQTSNSRGCIRYTSDPKICYSIDATTIAGSDTYRPTMSSDGGMHWRVLANDPTSGSAISLYASAQNTQQLLVSDYYNLYWSNNAGGSWTKLYTTKNSAGIHVAGATFFKGETFIALDRGVLASADNGQSFQWRNDIVGLDTTSQAILSFCAAETVGLRTTRTFYAVFAARGDVYGGVTALDAPAFKGLYTATSDSKQWQLRSTGVSSGDAPYFVACALSQEGTCYAAGGSNSSQPVVLRTSDAGAHWESCFKCNNNQNIATGWCGYDGDRAWSYGEYVLGLAVHPNDPSRVLITDLGFAHISRDGGASWQQCYVDSTTQNPAGIATPKGSTYRSVGMENTTCWQIVWLDSLNLYACQSDIQGTRSTDGGRTWGFNYSGHNDNSLYYVATDSAHGLAYAATSSVHDMYQSTYLADGRIDNGRGKVLFTSDKGATWKLMHDFAHPVVWLACGTGSSDALYASVVHSSAGGIYYCAKRSDGAAATWQKLPNPPRTEGHPLCIRILNNGDLLCSYSGRRNGTGAFTASSGVFLYSGSTWYDRSDDGMKYWTKDVVVDPNDPSQNTWLACVFSGWGGAPNGKGGLYRSTNRGLSWTRINAQDRVTSIRYNPNDGKVAYMTTETQGLFYFSDMSAAQPVAVQVESYNFRQPERVFFNPYKPGEMWVSSFGNGMKVSSSKSILQPPTLLAPTPSQALTHRRIEFSWQCAWNPKSYRIVIASDSAFTKTVVDQRWQSSQFVSFLKQWGQYYWRVKAYSDTDSSDWSELWPVYAPNTIDADSTESPLCGAKDVPLPTTLSWTRRGNEFQCIVVVASDPMLKQILLDTTINFGRSCVLQQLKAKTTYYWCVFNTGVDQNGESSDTCSFTTGESSTEVLSESAVASLYPQPVHNSLHLRLADTKSPAASIIFYDLKSRAIQQYDLHTTNNSEVQLDLSSLSPGLYQCVVYDAWHNALLVHRVCKED